MKYTPPLQYWNRVFLENTGQNKTKFLKMKTSQYCTKMHKTEPVKKWSTPLKRKSHLPKVEHHVWRSCAAEHRGISKICPVKIFLEYHDSPLVSWLNAYWQRRDFKIGHFHYLQTSVTMTLDQLIPVPIVYHSATSNYIPNSVQIRKTFMDGQTHGRTLAPGDS